ncbi:MAG: hypothetical protein ACFCAD_06165 [Pleurocapsa sp.]
MLKQFRSWLADKRSFLFSRYTQDSKETQEPEKSLVKLPVELRQKLTAAVENISSNPADKKAIVSTLDKAYDRWQEESDSGDNSVVVLSSPVAAVSRILSETLKEWTKERQIALKILPLTARPYAIETIKSKLEHYLKHKSEPDGSDSKTSEVVVIPNLSWCFLRSMDGLEGIEYLQSILCDGSKDRFWIIGAGQVGWQYLNSVCEIEAYCGETFSLPKIASEDLQEWLLPIIEDLDIAFAKPRIDQQLLDRDKDNQANYFDRLAEISQGVSTVAIQAFLKSISYQKEEDELGKIVAETPKTPSLPNLEPAEQYILYSLLLHGDLTVSALAKSLGDLESQVQAQVQVLRRKGIAEQKNRVIKINPIYYPKIKQELASNNFIINRE